MSEHGYVMVGLEASVIWVEPRKASPAEAFWRRRWPPVEGLSATHAECLESLIAMASEAASLLRTFPSLPFHHAQHAASSAFQTLHRGPANAARAMAIYGEARETFMAAIEAAGSANCRRAVVRDGGFVRLGCDVPNARAKAQGKASGTASASAARARKKGTEGV